MEVKTPNTPIDKAYLGVKPIKTPKDKGHSGVKLPKILMDEGYSRGCHKNMDEVLYHVEILNARRILENFCKRLVKVMGK